MNKLSFTLPKYTETIIRLVREIHKGLNETDEILGQIRTVQVAHGGATRQVSVPKILETEMKPYNVKVLFSLEWFRQTNAEEFAYFIWNLHELSSNEVKKGLFETVSKVTDATGNQFDAQGRNFWDAYVDIIQGSVMTFDEVGNHNHQCFVHPDTYKKIMATPPSPEQNQKIENAINAKREEYYAQKRTRRLS